MVDIFSLGCVYYYMLTRGRHPFGENFHRQVSAILMLLFLPLSVTRCSQEEGSYLLRELSQTV
jgi:hypothetical protein